MTIGRIPEPGTGIPESIIAAKGDILTGTANDTPAVLTVGADGTTLVADSAATTGLSYQSNWAAGKNKIINGDFRVWQRGTSFTGQSGYPGTYCADRFTYGKDGTSTPSFSQQTFTPGTAPVAGYEGQFFGRFTVASWSASPVWVTQRIEDVRTFANQTMTLSFWAKAAAGITYTPLILQDFGSGGSGQVITNASSSITLTTSWARYSVNFTVPSISGKTIGTSSCLVVFPIIISANATIDIWGVQVEAGSVATAFQTATGTIQGELAACQRYYWNISGDSQMIGTGYYQTATEVNVTVDFPVTMRTTPTLTAATGTNYYDLKTNGAQDFFNDFSGTAAYAGTNATVIFTTTNVSGTVGRAGGTRTNNASAKLEFSAEL